MTSSRSGFAYFAVALSVLWIHGLILLNRGLYFDGAIYYSLVTHGQVNELLSHFKALAFPQVAYLHLFVGRFADPLLAYKSVVFAAILVSSWSVYSMARLSRSQLESYFIAVLFASYPGNQTYVETGCLQYPICLALFLFGWVVALRGDIYSRPQYIRIGARVVALALMFMAFTVNSLLTFHFGFLFYWYWLSRSGGLLFERRAILHFTREKWAYVLLPVVFWVTKGLFLKPVGVYDGYNKISIHGRIFKYLYKFLEQGLVLQFPKFILTYLMAPFTGWLGLAFFAAISSMFLWRSESDEFADRNRRKMTGMMALLLFFLGAFPYAAVSKAPRFEGWDTRHALLMGLPAALLVMWGCSFIATRRLRVIVALLVTGWWSGIQVDNYLDQQVRWIKDASIVRQLKLRHQDLKFGVALIEDGFPIQSEFYRFYEWNGLLSQVWPAQDRLGINRINELPTAEEIAAKDGGAWKAHYLFSNWSPGGPWIKLQIERHDSRPNWLIAVSALYRQLAGQSDALSDQIDDTVRVQASDLAAPSD